MIRNGYYGKKKPEVLTATDNNDQDNIGDIRTRNNIEIIVNTDNRKTNTWLNNTNQDLNQEGKGCCRQLRKYQQEGTGNRHLECIRTFESDAY